jgi:hypothetical protein
MVVIGLRSAQVFVNPEMKDDVLKRQFITYVVYFLLAIYLVSFFEEQRTVSKGDENFGEADYKRLFEFKMDTSHKHEPSPDDEAGAEEREKYEEDFDDMEVDVTNSVYKKKSWYSYRDLIEFYENTRFTGPFIIYR